MFIRAGVFIRINILCYNAVKPGFAFAFSIVEMNKDYSDETT